MCFVTFETCYIVHCTMFIGSEHFCAITACFGNFFSFIFQMRILKWQKQLQLVENMTKMLEIEKLWQFREYSSCVTLVLWCKLIINCIRMKNASGEGACNGNDMWNMQWSVRGCRDGTCRRWIRMATTFYNQFVTMVLLMMMIIITEYIMRSN